ncbi:hypothetical protein HGRIS_000197 [Hohenbuehelia grisea]|uniref:Zinc finger RING-type eukaryotic domain-containing protein n=1 Tax=Hohenbuehelia grisea TaxID=104357 RepID=A0ABR3JRP1_9AGAR
MASCSRSQTTSEIVSGSRDSCCSSSVEGFSKGGSKDMEGSTTDDVPRTARVGCSSGHARTSFCERFEDDASGEISKTPKADCRSPCNSYGQRHDRVEFVSECHDPHCGTSASVNDADGADCRVPCSIYSSPTPSTSLGKRSEAPTTSVGVADSSDAADDLQSDFEDMEDLVFNANPDIPEDLADSESECEDETDETGLHGQSNVIGEEMPFLCPMCRTIPNDLRVTACGHLFCTPIIGKKASILNSHSAKSVDLPSATPAISSLSSITLPTILPSGSDSGILPSDTEVSDASATVLASVSVGVGAGERRGFPLGPSNESDRGGRFGRPGRGVEAVELGAPPPQRQKCLLQSPLPSLEICWL